MADVDKIIREQDPLKQGLKQFFCELRDCMGDIREQDPLKQGLKLLWSIRTVFNFCNS